MPGRATATRPTVSSKTTLAIGILTISADAWAAVDWQRSICYCTVRVTVFACDAPPASVAVTVICEIPSAVGVAILANAEPGAVATGEVAVTVIVAGVGTIAGAVYKPVESTVPLAFPPATAQVTL